MNKLRFNAIDNYITIRTLFLFYQYTIFFLKSKSMSILSRSDISFYQCKFMFAILLHLLLLFLYKLVGTTYKVCKHYHMSRQRQTVPGKQTRIRWPYLQTLFQVLYEDAE